VVPARVLTGPVLTVPRDLPNCTESEYKFSGIDWLRAQLFHASGFGRRESWRLRLFDDATSGRLPIADVYFVKPTIDDSPAYEDDTSMLRLCVSSAQSYSTDRTLIDDAISPSLYHVLASVFASKQPPMRLPPLQASAVSAGAQLLAERYIDEFVREQLQQHVFDRLLELGQCGGAGLPCIKSVRGLILHGPPGTGKTEIARLLRDVFGFRIVFFGAAARMQGSWKGQTERKLRVLFEEARLFRVVPSLIVFDEIDALTDSGGGGGGGDGDGADGNSASRSTILATLLDELSSDNNGHLLFIGITNKIAALDTALTRSGRLGMRMFVGPPKSVEIAQRLFIGVLSSFIGTKNQTALASLSVSPEFGDATINFGAADLAEVARRVAIKMRTSVDPSSSCVAMMLQSAASVVDDAFKNPQLISYSSMPSKSANAISLLIGADVAAMLKRGSIVRKGVDVGVRVSGRLLIDTEHATLLVELSPFGVHRIALRPRWRDEGSFGGWRDKTTASVILAFMRALDVRHSLRLGAERSDVWVGKHSAKVAATQESLVIECVELAKRGGLLVAIEADALLDEEQSYDDRNDEQAGGVILRQISILSRRLANQARRLFVVVLTQNTKRRQQLERLWSMNYECVFDDALRSSVMLELSTDRRSVSIKQAGPSAFGAVALRIDRVDVNDLLHIFERGILRVQFRILRIAEAGAIAIGLGALSAVDQPSGSFTNAIQGIRDGFLLAGDSHSQANTALTRVSLSSAHQTFVLAIDPVAGLLTMDHVTGCCGQHIQTRVASIQSSAAIGCSSLHALKLVFALSGRVAVSVDTCASSTVDSL
jgi:hypothetical protein